jgi:nucleoid DNA-binding protein
MSITIKDLTDTVSAVSGLTKKASEVVVASLFEKVGTELKSGNEVTVRDFGRFYTKTRDARTARNPKTGEAVQVPAKTVIKFSPRGAMK